MADYITILNVCLHIFSRLIYSQFFPSGDKNFSNSHLIGIPRRQSTRLKLMNLHGKTENSALCVPAVYLNKKSISRDLCRWT